MKNETEINVPHQHPRRIRWARWFFLVIFLAVLSIAISIWGARKALHSGGKEQVLGFVSADDSIIHLQGGNTFGVSRREKREHDWYVFATAALPESKAGTTYHAWLENPSNGERRYMGELFATQEGQWSVTYTTQEDIAPFAVVRVSREETSQPIVPADTVTSWRFSQ